MSEPRANRVGHVYRCSVCGAEVSVVRPGYGGLAPRCCNTAMIRLPGRHETYRCPVCGAEVMVIRGGAGPLTPRCCNTDMIAREIAA